MFSIHSPVMFWIEESRHWLKIFWKLYLSSYNWVSSKKSRQLHGLSCASVARFDAHLEIIPENKCERTERQKYSMKFPVKRKLIRMLLHSLPLSLFLHFPGEIFATASPPISESHLCEWSVPSAIRDLGLRLAVTPPNSLLANEDLVSWDLRMGFRH